MREEDEIPDNMLGFRVITCEGYMVGGKATGTEQTEEAFREENEGRMVS